MQPTPVRSRQQPARAVTKSIPPPRPLSPRARAFVAQAHAEARERQQAIEKATALAVSVVKAAAKTDQVAVYDAAGNLIGICDPDDLTPVASAQAPGKPKPADMTPAPKGDIGTPAAAAKAMSVGAERSGQRQLGGPHPRGGVPTVPAEDAEPQEVTKARVQTLSANLKKALNGGSGASAAEVNRVADAMNQAAISKFYDMQRRGLAASPQRRA